MEVNEKDEVWLVSLCTSGSVLSLKIWPYISHKTGVPKLDNNVYGNYVKCYLTVANLSNFLNLCHKKTSLSIDIDREMFLC